MIMYEYRCKSCEHLMTALREIDDRNDCPACEECGEATKKVISGVKVHPDFEPYYDPNLETHIQSKQHRKKVMREKGVSEAYGKGWQ